MRFEGKKVAVYIGVLILAIITSAADFGGELVGVQGRSVGKKEIPPYGMVLIPQGTFNMGLNDQDAIFAMNAPTKTVTIDAFWIDQTEITNNEYRQFVEYVRDSVFRRLLGEQFEEFVELEDEFGNPYNPPKLNWKIAVDLRNTDYQDVLQVMYTPVEESVNGRKSLKTDKLIYSYTWLDDKSLMGKYPRKVNQEGADPNSPLSYVYKENIKIYPDTLVWLRDFDFAFNDPFAARYFSHPAYDDYPVVGVSWHQAKAFCDWRTKMMQDYQSKRSKFMPHDYRLPTEAEWEYAARGGLEQQMYPWGGPYTYNQQGCYLANFQPQRSRYSIDGGTRTLPVGSYPANDYGLYDMSGNVAEWTISAYDEQSYSFGSPMNPDYRYNAKDTEPMAMKRKTIRGGSWKDIAYFLQCGARTFEYQDTSKSYIGFRCVRSYLGR